MRFAEKRKQDEQKKRALAQFGHGDKPPTPEDPEPTRMTAPIEECVVEAVAEAV